MSRKITDLVKDSGHVSYSFEVTPDINEEELEHLSLEPLFFSVTWHAQTHQCINLEIAPLKLVSYLRNKGKNVLLHISCANMKKDYLDMLLTTLQNKGICNLFIILGENFDPKNTDFKRSQELIIYVRQRTGNYFCIGVAGFPDRDDKILQLKEKVDSGADFILTQAFFEHSVYEKYRTKCIEQDINIPVIPGIFPFETKKEFDSFVNLCKVQVANDSIEIFTEKPGIDLVAKLIYNMIEELQVKHFHIFTLNKLQRTLKLINRINSINN